MKIKLLSETIQRKASEKYSTTLQTCFSVKNVAAQLTIFPILPFSVSIALKMAQTLDYGSEIPKSSDLNKIYCAADFPVVSLYYAEQGSNVLACYFTDHITPARSNYADNRAL